MAVAVGSVRIDLFANFAEFREGLDKATAHMRRFGRDLDKTARGLQNTGARLGLAVTAPLALFGAAALRASSEAQDLQGAFNLAFGDAADATNQWAKDTGDAMGRSTQTIQKTAIAFQEFFEDFAPTDEAARDLSKTFTVLTEDFAALKNVTREQALDTLLKGAAGSARALKALGIVIDEQAVKQKAVQLGIAGTNDKLTEQQKVLARSVIIAEGTAKANGEVARSQGEAEEQTKRAREEFQEMLVTVGDELLPVFSEFLKLAQSVIRGFNSLDDNGRRVVVVLGALAAAAGPVVFAIGGIVKVAGLAVTGVRLLSASFVQATGAANTFAGAASRALAALAAAPLVFEGGKKIAGFFHDTGPPIEEVRAHAHALVAELERVGVSSDVARQSVAQLLNTVGNDATKLTGEAALAIARMNGAVTETTPPVDEANKAVEELVRNMGLLSKPTEVSADELERVRDAVFPIAAALETYNENLRLAKIAGIDAADATAAFGAQLVQQIGGVDEARKHLEELPPVVRDIVNEFDDAADLEDKVKAGLAAADEFLQGLEEARKNAEREAEREKQALLDFAKDLSNQFDPAAVFTEQMARIEEAFRSGAISAEVYEKAKRAAFEETPEGERQLEILRQQERVIYDVATAFTDAVTGARNLGDALKQIAIDALSSNVIKPFFGDILRGAAGVFGFGGSRDAGGPVFPGMAYNIGSGVRETFVPDVPGRITRGNGMGGAGGDVTVNVYAQDASSFRGSERQIARAQKRALNR